MAQNTVHPNATPLPITALDTPPIPHLKRRRWLTIGIAAALLVLFIGYMGVAYIGYGVIATSPMEYTRNPPDGAYEDVSFLARGRSYSVYGYLLAPENDNGLALVNVHGRFGSRHSDYQHQRAEWLRGLGYTVLSIDLSDNGGDTVEDGRSSLGYDEQFDVLGAFDYLVDNGFSPDQIGLMGESMGATTVLSAAVREPHIRAVWADSAYTRADTVLMEQSSSAGFPPIFVPGGMVWAALLSNDLLWDVAPLSAGATFAANGQAIYLTHCEGDTVVYAHHSADLQAAYIAAGANSTFWDQDCQQHTESLFTRTDDYLARLDAFFTENLVAGT